MNLPDLVVFDLDGCLIDSELIALAELEAILGQQGIILPTGLVREQFLGTSIEASAAWAIEQGSKLSISDFTDAWHESLYARYTSELRPMPGAVDFLSRLDAIRIPYCIATGASVGRMARALRHTGLDQWFEGRAFSADIVAEGKPAPDLFLHAAATLGVPAERCLVVEDAPAGVTAAARAGMAAVGFVGGSHLSEVRSVHAALLASLGAAAVFEDFGTLSKAVLDQGLRARGATG